MANLSAVRLRGVDIRTDQVTDWLDGLPVIGQPAAAGVVAGSANVGRADLVVSAVDAGTAEGAHLLTVTAIVAGLAAFTVTDPDGAVTGEGVAGAALYAGGLTLTLTPLAGQPLAVGDTFALAVLPAPVDISGLVFDLTARLTARSATVMLAASSAPADGAVPTILTGGAAGTLAMRVLRARMARCPVGDYPYTITATDPATGRSVAAFVGTLRHRALPSLQD